eukprot:TRINITY_DN12186_c0_g1_i2.p1 TRINITY_DN12186_c0_g1~~TRINITY_DN12186_c0_g1_i2.p1  ORF type:complete len:401 (-),score=51.00 TRINITY_DN12186_c0_g1_i2:13-1215(-)
MAKRAASFIAMSAVSWSAVIDIVNPFRRDVLRELYDPYGIVETGMSYSLDSIASIWQRIADNVSRLSRNEEFAGAYGRLILDGLLVNVLGMDFTEVQARRYGFPSTFGRELLEDPDVKWMRSTYYMTRVDRFRWTTDMPLWYRRTSLEDQFTRKEQAMISKLRRDGFVQIRRWAGLDLEELRREYKELRSLGARGLKLELRSVRQLARKGSLPWRLAWGYFGARARYMGYELIHVSVEDGRYQNAYWHHDGCGQRLKMFVYLYDVDNYSHPTTIVPGTHRTHWFPTTSYFAGIQGHNKIREAMVHQVYGDDIRTMVAAAGGGFVFDANALHSADVTHWRRPRDAVVLEWFAEDHAAQIPRGKRGTLTRSQTCATLLARRSTRFIKCSQTISLSSAHPSHQ